MTIRAMLLSKKDYIVAAYLAGKSTCELGRELGCSNASVFVFLRRMGVELRIRKVLDANIDKIKELHKQGMSAYAIDKKLGIGKSTAERALKQLGIDISHRQHKRKDQLKNHEAEIIALYESGVGSYLIGKKFGCQDATIVRFLIKRGVQLRPLWQYHVNESFFDVIDTEEKAYVLGFWYADGCNQTGVPVVEITITDEDILRVMASALQFDGPVDIVLPAKPNHLIRYRIRIGSRKMSDSLIRVGCMQNKTYHATFPTTAQVPTNLHRHFIRGLSDGDGTITSRLQKYGRRAFHSRIVGTHAICDGLKVASDVALGIRGSVCPVHTSSTGYTTYAFTVGAQADLKLYLNWLYADATIYLRRKYDKYQEFLGYTYQAA